MDTRTWPQSIKSKKNRKGQVKTTRLPYPLLEGGALTAATLGEDSGGLKWVTAQGRTSSMSNNVGP